MREGWLDQRDCDTMDEPSFVDVRAIFSSAERGVATFVVVLPMVSLWIGLGIISGSCDILRDRRWSFVFKRGRM